MNRHFPQSQLTKQKQFNCFLYNLPPNQCPSTFKRTKKGQQQLEMAPKWIPKSALGLPEMDKKKIIDLLF